jgi:hypothetical protein
MECVVTRDPDPVVVRRARIGRAVAVAKRVGYLFVLVAVAGFVAAVLAGFPDWAVTLTIVALVGACVILPVPIVLGYGLRAAEREERRSGQLGSDGGDRR